MGQGTLLDPPTSDACDLCQVPLGFRERPLIVTGLGYLQGFLQERTRPWLVERLLHRQDRQAVEGYTDQRELMLAPRIG